MLVNRFDYNQDMVGQGRWLLDHGNVSTVEASMCLGALADRVNPVVFDVGANIGTFCTWMARALPQGRVYAFEPQRPVFQILTANIAINNFYNVWTYPCALGAENHTVQFQEPDYFSPVDFGIFSLVQDKIPDKSSVQNTVDVFSLDWFVQHHSVPQVDLIKIDAEGMDLAVLEGARDNIARWRPVIFIEHCDNQRSIQADMEAWLAPYGYGFSVQGNNLLAVI